MNPFLPHPPQDFDPIFDRIAKDKMLISAAADGKANTMTASWGCCGVLWNKPVAICFIRPQRFTYPIIEKSDTFSLSFFSKEYDDVIRFCGTYSGRDGDKFTAAGLTCAFADCGTPYPAEASTVLICRKLYAGKLLPECFINTALFSNYVDGDFHKMYIGEIENFLCQRS